MTNWSEIRKTVGQDQPVSRIPEGTRVLPVVGVSFVTGYPSNLFLLQNIHAKRTSPFLFVDLVRNPDNPYDKNAVEVRFGDSMLGHLSKDVAAEVAPILDSGTQLFASVFQVRISPENPDNPGLDILIDDWA
jgi:hypothetical protein